MSYPARAEGLVNRVNLILYNIDHFLAQIILKCKDKLCRKSFIYFFSFHCFFFVFVLSTSLHVQVLSTKFLSLNHPPQNFKTFSSYFSLLKLLFVTIIYTYVYIFIYYSHLNKQFLPKQTKSFLRSMCAWMKNIKFFKNIHISIWIFHTRSFI